MRIIILFVLFVSICFECIGQCGKDTVFLKIKYCKEDFEIIENDNGYYLSKYVETIKHDTIPLINRRSQIIYGDWVLKGTQGQILTSDANIYLDSAKVEKIGSDEKYLYSIDSIVTIEENDSKYTVVAIIDGPSGNLFSLFDINLNFYTNDIELWAYPYEMYGSFGFEKTLYKLTYYLTKTNDKKKFKFKFKRIINYN